MGVGSGHGGCCGAAAGGREQVDHKGGRERNGEWLVAAMRDFGPCPPSKTCGARARVFDAGLLRGRHICIEVINGAVMCKSMEMSHASGFVTVLADYCSAFPCWLQLFGSHIPNWLGFVESGFLLLACCTLDHPGLAYL